MDQYRQKSATTPAPQNRQPEQQPTVVRKTRPGKSKKRLVISIIAIVVLAFGAGAVYKFVLKKNDNNLVGVNSGQYQALFLTNGQVYFGKLSKADGKTIRVDDIFYLQVQQAVQPKAEGTNDQGETQLIKLGGELHGPEDTMYIDRNQVLFWENLKSDGKVVQAIAQYKKQ